MIFTPQEPVKYFHQIYGPLQEAIDNSGKYVAIGQPLRDIVEGSMKLYIIRDDDTDDFKGFALVEILDLSNGPWLNIPFAWAKDGSYDEFFDFMKSLAWEHGMNGVKFISSRPGFEKKAEQYGWKKGFTEWIVEDFRGK